MSKWYSIRCSECYGEIMVHEDWSNPPTLCSSCKSDKAEKWYDISCAG